VALTSMTHSCEAACLYSPKCLEQVFSEVRSWGRSARRIHREFIAVYYAVQPLHEGKEPRVKVQDSYLPYF
jgi:hypothetical protein